MGTQNTLHRPDLGNVLEIRRSKQAELIAARSQAGSTACVVFLGVRFILNKGRFQHIYPICTQWRAPTHLEPVVSKGSSRYHSREDRPTRWTVWQLSRFFLLFFAQVSKRHEVFVRDATLFVATLAARAPSRASLESVERVLVQKDKGLSPLLTFGLSIFSSAGPFCCSKIPRIKLRQ